MTQQNCRPCQGIQTLTPVSFRNYAGQKAINYRVGTYSDFFESMLASLSRGRKNESSDEKSILRHLTAREKDDPSIAMLDAWAVLADVLTFYNERYISEGFLRTATQSASLHEIANLVGYTPRPGLSSSVYLAFEVDERSDEVLIPAGTAAKSTPIPGSGETPETFETSVDFVGRPGFNKIRPRLSKPHDLRPTSLVDLKQLYLKGTGLRIQPNDFIAIGAKGLDVPKLKKVISAEERKDTVRGPITVLSLELDLLAPSHLLDDVESAVNSFFEDNATNTLIEANDRNISFNVYKNAIDLARLESRSLGLTHADKEITAKLLIEMILSASNTFRAILNLIHSNLIASNTNLIDRSKLKMTSLFDTFKQRHKDIGELLNRRIALLPATMTISDTNEILAMEQFAYRVESPPLAEPMIYHALRKDRPTINAGEKLFPNVVFRDSSNTLPATPNFKVVYDVSGGASAPIDTTTGTLLAIEQSVINQTLAGDGYAYFHITHNDGSADTFIAAGVQHFNDGSTTPEVTINSTEKIGFVRASASIPIDGGFALTLNGADGGFSYEISVLEGEGTLTNQMGSGLTSNGVQNAIVGAKYSPPSTIPPNEKRATFLIAIRKNANAVAFALRTLVFDDQPIFTRSLLADVLSNPVSTLAITKSNWETQRDIAIGVDTAADVFLAVTQSASINSALKDDKYSLIASPNTMSITEETTLLLNGIKGIGNDRKSDATNLPALQLSGVKASADELANCPIANLSDLSDLKDKFNSLIAKIGSASTQASEVHRKYFVMANAILLALNNRRKMVVDRLFSISTSIQSVLTGAPQGSPESKINGVLTDLFDKDGTTASSFYWRLKQADVPIEQTTSSATVESIRVSLYQLVDDVRSIIDNSIQPSQSSLSALAASSVASLVRDWTDILRLIGISDGTSATTPTTTTTSISDLLGQVRSVIDFNSLTSSSLTDFLEGNSALWPQVLAALDPDQRQKLVAIVRDFAVIGTPQEGNVSVWVFRSQANLFGWNSPGRVYSETVSETTTSKRGTQPLDYTDESLEDGEVLADGKLSKTVSGSPIGLMLLDKPDPSGFWSADVSFAPHTAFGISNESTRIVDSKTPLPGTSTTWFGLTKSFDVIRSSKVLCDAEELQLSEVLLADDEFDFLIPVNRTAKTFELDEFQPELAVGKKVSLSGVEFTQQFFSPKSPERNAPNVAMRSEIVTIVDVQHPYPNPLIHGGAIRTKVVIQEKLAHTYWRNTLEICANVVEATHGETVVETLGSGDARKPFQKFRLSRAPLTRLPAPNAEGKQEALKVSVSSTTWDEVEHLVNASPRDEVYELKGNRRDSATTIQFGNGLHGTRLPTGIENVKAIYRTGLGVSGNVQPGQINQLPSPPFGVKTVANPLRGDGGADADTIEQTRMRVPGLTSTMGRLVSKKDYENFALLFAGIDKVAIEEQSGILVIYVAGNTPTPLADSGQLLINLRNAIEQQSEPGISIQVAAHQGLLLHILAKVSVDSRHDWDPIKLEIEIALLNRFGYANAKLGQDILASEVVQTIQQVKKVNFVVIEKLLGLVSSEEQRRSNTTRQSSSSERPQPGQVNNRVEVFVDEVCYIDALVSSTVQLERIG